MTIEKYYKLSNLQKLCTLCNKSFTNEEIIDNCIEVYKKRRFYLAHKTCFAKMLTRKEKINDNI